MAKRILLTLLQFLAFGTLMFFGAFWAIVLLYHPGLAVIPVWRIHLSATHDFIANGVLFAFVLLLLILLLQAIRKALRPWASLSVLAFILALMLSFAMKLGMITMTPSV